jgi:signal peptidase II
MAQRVDVPGPPALRRTPIYKDLALFQLALLFFLADQFSKFLVREFLELGESLPAQGFFRITHTYNTGSAFGLFRDQNFPLILASLIGITILVLIYRSQPRHGKVLRLSLALQLGGAAGNLLDRLRLGHVTDFLDVGIWPVFNLADSSIVIGLLMLAWLFLRPEQRRGESQPSPAIPEAAGGAQAGSNQPAEPIPEEDSG